MIDFNVAEIKTSLFSFLSQYDRQFPSNIGESMDVNLPYVPRLMVSFWNLSSDKQNDVAFNIKIKTSLFSFLSQYDRQFPSNIRASMNANLPYVPRPMLFITMYLPILPR
jgi:hypothetical protein